MQRHRVIAARLHALAGHADALGGEVDVRPAQSENRVRRKAGVDADRDRVQRGGVERRVRTPRSASA